MLKHVQNSAPTLASLSSFPTFDHGCHTYIKQEIDLTIYFFLLYCAWGTRFTG